MSTNKFKCIYFIFALFLLIIPLFLFEPYPWTIDNGNKIIASTNGENALDIPYQLATKDSLLKFSPFKEPFVSLKNRNIYSVFSPLFLNLVKIVNKISPLKESVSFSFFILLFIIIAYDFKFNPYSILITFSTPLLFYAYTCWEMTISAFFIYLLFRKDLIHDTKLNNPNLNKFTGIWAGIAIILRPENIFLLFYPILTKKRNKIFFYTEIILIYLINSLYLYHIKGSLFSGQISKNFIIPNIFQNLYTLIFQFSKNIFPFYILLSFIILMIIFKILEKEKISNRITVISTIFIASYWVYYIYHFNFDFISIANHNSLIFTYPIILMLFTIKLDKTAIIIVSIMLAIIICTPISSGVHFGPRLIVSYLPLISIYIFQNIKKAKLLVYFLIFITFSIQISGLYLLDLRKKIVKKETEFISINSENDLILFDNWWSASDYPDIFQSKKMAAVLSEKECIDFFKTFKINITLITTNPNTSIYNYFFFYLKDKIRNYSYKNNFRFSILNLNSQMIGNALNAKAIDLAKKQKYLKSNRYLETAIFQNNTNDKFYFNLAINHGLLKNYKTSLKYLKKANKLNSKEMYKNYIKKLENKINR